MNDFEDIKYKINMKDITSSFIKRNIFSFLSSKQKLKIIMYNKKYQKMILVDKEDYKKISNKYKIDGKNGKGKEYIINTNILIFEGEYINGKKSGKGKEYNDFGHLKFEGEYLNGKKSGKGKEYDYGELMFEGEYLNGKRSGKGKEYFYNGMIYFEGEYLNGERSGKGKEYFI